MGCLKYTTIEMGVPKYTAKTDRGEPEYPALRGFFIFLQ